MSGRLLSLSASLRHHARRQVLRPLGIAGSSGGSICRRGFATDGGDEDSVQRYTPIENRFDAYDDAVYELMDDKLRENPNWNPTTQQLDRLEEEAMYNWAVANKYALIPKGGMPKVDEADDTDEEPMPKKGEDGFDGTVKKSSDNDDWVDVETPEWEHDFDNYQKRDEWIENIEREYETANYMLNPHDETESKSEAEAAVEALKVVGFGDESRALLDDILQDASPAAQRSVEQLVHGVYGADGAAKYLKDMRTPTLPDDALADGHWAKPLLEQYLKVMDANPYYTPKQIETTLTQFAHELNKEYYAKDEMFVTNDGIAIDDWPQVEDEGDDDDGYLN